MHKRRFAFMLPCHGILHMMAQPLSTALRALCRALNDDDGCGSELARMHNRAHARLVAIMQHDDMRCHEYSVLDHFLKAEKARRKTATTTTTTTTLHGEKSRLYMLAVEYLFDDGGFSQGHGDVLFWREDGTLVVVECKVVRGDGGRLSKVHQQANTYSRRLRSWIRHLCREEEDGRHLCHNKGVVALGQARIVAAILTEESNRLQVVDADRKNMESPGVEPGSGRRGQRCGVLHVEN